MALGWYSRSEMIPKMRLRVSLATSGRLLITRDTVCLETPACLATSYIVALAGLPKLHIHSFWNESGTGTGTVTGHNTHIIKE
jgi:hypothetical protein